MITTVGSSIESAIRTQTRFHHLIGTSTVGPGPTWKRSSMRPPGAIGSLIHRRNFRWPVATQIFRSLAGQNVLFFLRGPMKLRSLKEFQFWREAPRIGLTGVAEIEIGERGVAAKPAWRPAYCAAAWPSDADHSRIAGEAVAAGRGAGGWRSSISSLLCPMRAS